MPKSLEERRTWLGAFVDALQNTPNGLAAKYGISAANLTALARGRQWFDWALANLPVARTAATTLTAFKENLISGSGPLSLPLAPAYTDVPTEGGGATIPPQGGVFALASSLGQQIKTAINYDPADGVALGLEGAPAAMPDPATTAPDLRRSAVSSGGHIEIDWAKGPFDGVKIEVDRGDGKGFLYLATDTAPNYLDTVNPAPGATALYRYRAIYLHDDADYGQWSPVVEIPVRG